MLRLVRREQRRQVLERSKPGRQQQPIERCGAERTGIQALAQAGSIAAIEEARVKAEHERMAIYRDFPTERLLGLAAQRLAEKLQKIEHLNLTPDLLGTLLTRLVETGTQRLEREAGR